jgi:glucokinase
MPATSRVFLAGDIGGTSTRLGLFEVAGGKPVPRVVERYGSREHAGLGAIVRVFRAAHPEPIAAACFGVAGPILGGHVETPNLPWVVDSAPLAQEIGLERVHLINDLEANAHGIFALGPDDVEVLNPGAAGAPGNGAVISAGTGLGEAGLYWDGRYHQPFACEGGHTGYAPHTDEGDALLRHLRGRFGGHVSWERVVSGPGIASIYEFLRGTDRGSEPDWLRQAIAAGDPPAVITEAALGGRSELCGRALDLFVSAYGAEAGNLALKMMATRGVYVGGGIAPKVLPRLRAGAFMEAFTAKGRLRHVLETVPVRVITNDRTALLGAARFAGLEASLLAPAAL